MAKKKGRGTTSLRMRKLIRLLRKVARENNVWIWRKIADELGTARRGRREVNVWKIERFAKEGEVIIVPGKVLDGGELKKKVNVGAYGFSAEARRKIEKVGKVLMIEDVVEENPRGKGVRVIC